jgi:hypothetical protein
VPDVTKFAGFRSPWSLVTDPSLSREDKLGGLRTWHALLAAWQQGEGDAAARGRLLTEIERALARLAGERAARGSDSTGKS